MYKKLVSEGRFSKSSGTVGNGSNSRQKAGDTSLKTNFSVVKSGARTENSLPRSIPNIHCTKGQNSSDSNVLEKENVERKEVHLRGSTESGRVTEGKTTHSSTCSLPLHIAGSKKKSEKKKSLETLKGNSKNPLSLPGGSELHPSTEETFALPFSNSSSPMSFNISSPLSLLSIPPPPPLPLLPSTLGNPARAAALSDSPHISIPMAAVGSPSPLTGEVESERGGGRTKGGRQEGRSDRLSRASDALPGEMDGRSRTRGRSSSKKDDSSISERGRHPSGSPPEVESHQAIHVCSPSMKSYDRSSPHKNEDISIRRKRKGEENAKGKTRESKVEGEVILKKRKGMLPSASIQTSPSVDHSLFHINQEGKVLHGSSPSSSSVDVKEKTEAPYGYSSSFISLDEGVVGLNIDLVPSRKEREEQMILAAAPSPFSSTSSSGSPPIQSTKCETPYPISIATLSSNPHESKARSGEVEAQKKEKEEVQDYVGEATTIHRKAMTTAEVGEGSTYLGCDQPWQRKRKSLVSFVREVAEDIAPSEPDQEGSPMVVNRERESTSAPSFISPSSTFFFAVPPRPHPPRNSLRPSSPPCSSMQDVSEHQQTVERVPPPPALPPFPPPRPCHCRNSKDSIPSFPAPSSTAFSSIFTPPDFQAEMKHKRLTEASSHSSLRDQEEVVFLAHPHVGEGKEKRIGGGEGVGNVDVEVNHSKSKAQPYTMECDTSSLPSPPRASTTPSGLSSLLSTSESPPGVAHGILTSSFSTFSSAAREGEMMTLSKSWKIPDGDGKRKEGRVCHLLVETSGSTGDTIPSTSPRLSSTLFSNHADDGPLVGAAQNLPQWRKTEGEQYHSLPPPHQGDAMQSGTEGSGAEGSQQNPPTTGMDTLRSAMAPSTSSLLQIQRNSFSSAINSSSILTKWQEHAVGVSPFPIHASDSSLLPAPGSTPMRSTFSTLPADGRSLKDRINPNPSSFQKKRVGVRQRRRVGAEVASNTSIFVGNSSNRSVSIMTTATTSNMSSKSSDSARQLRGNSEKISGGEKSFSRQRRRRRRPHSTSSSSGTYSTNMTSNVPPAFRLVVVCFVMLFLKQNMKILRQYREEKQRVARMPKAAFIIQCCFRRYQQCARLQRHQASLFLGLWFRFQCRRMNKAKEESILLLQRFFRGERDRSFFFFMHHQARRNRAIRVMRHFVQRWEAKNEMDFLRAAREERNVTIEHCSTSALSILREERKCWLDIASQGQKLLHCFPLTTINEWAAEVTTLTGYHPVWCTTISVVSGWDSPASTEKTSKLPSNFTVVTRKSHYGNNSGAVVYDGQDNGPDVNRKFHTEKDSMMLGASHPAEEDGSRRAQNYNCLSSFGGKDTSPLHYRPRDPASVPPLQGSAGSVYPTPSTYHTDCRGPDILEKDDTGNTYARLHPEYSDFAGVSFEEVSGPYSATATPSLEHEEQDITKKEKGKEGIFFYSSKDTNPVSPHTPQFASSVSASSDKKLSILRMSDGPLFPIHNASLLMYSSDSGIISFSGVARGNHVMVRGFLDCQQSLEDDYPNSNSRRNSSSFGSPHQLPPSHSAGPDGRILIPKPYVSRIGAGMASSPYAGPLYKKVDNAHPHPSNSWSGNEEEGERYWKWNEGTARPASIGSSSGGDGVVPCFLSTEDKIKPHDHWCIMPDNFLSCSSMSFSFASLLLAELSFQRLFFRSYRKGKGMSKAIPLLQRLSPLQHNAHDFLMDLFRLETPDYLDTLFPIQQHVLSFVQAVELASTSVIQGEEEGKEGKGESRSSVRVTILGGCQEDDEEVSTSTKLPKKHNRENGENLNSASRIHHATSGNSNSTQYHSKENALRSLRDTKSSIFCGSFLHLGPFSTHEPFSPSLILTEKGLIEKENQISISKGLEGENDVDSPLSGCNESNNVHTDDNNNMTTHNHNTNETTLLCPISPSSAWEDTRNAGIQILGVKTGASPKIKNSEMNEVEKGGWFANEVEKSNREGGDLQKVLSRRPPSPPPLPPLPLLSKTTTTITSTSTEAVTRSSSNNEVGGESNTVSFHSVCNLTRNIPSAEEGIEEGIENPSLLTIISNPHKWGEVHLGVSSERPAANNVDRMNASSNDQVTTADTEVVGVEEKVEEKKMDHLNIPQQSSMASTREESPKKIFHANTTRRLRMSHGKEDNTKHTMNDVLSAFKDTLIRTESIERQQLQQQILEEHRLLLRPLDLIQHTLRLVSSTVPAFFADLLLEMKDTVFLQRAGRLFAAERHSRLKIIEEYVKVPLRHLICRPVLDPLAERRSGHVFHHQENSFPSPIEIAEKAMVDESRFSFHLFQLSADEKGNVVLPDSKKEEEKIAIKGDDDVSTSANEACIASGARLKGEVGRGIIMSKGSSMVSPPPTLGNSSWSSSTSGGGLGNSSKDNIFQRRKSKKKRIFHIRMSPTVLAEQESRCRRGELTLAGGLVVEGIPSSVKMVEGGKVPHIQEKFKKSPSHQFLSRTRALVSPPFSLSRGSSALEEHQTMGYDPKHFMDDQGNLEGEGEEEKKQVEGMVSPESGEKDNEEVCEEGPFTSSEVVRSRLFPISSSCTSSNLPLVQQRPLSSLASFIPAPPLPPLFAPCAGFKDGSLHAAVNEPSSSTSPAAASDVVVGDDNAIGTEGHEERGVKASILAYRPHSFPPPMPGDFSGIPSTYEVVASSSSRSTSRRHGSGESVEGQVVVPCIALSSIHEKGKHTLSPDPPSSVPTTNLSPYSSYLCCTSRISAEKPLHSLPPTTSLCSVVKEKRDGISAVGEERDGRGGGSESNGLLSPPTAFSKLCPNTPAEMVVIIAQEKQKEYLTNERIRESTIKSQKKSRGEGEGEGRGEWGPDVARSSYRDKDEKSAKRTGARCLSEEDKMRRSETAPWEDPPVLVVKMRKKEDEVKTTMWAEWEEDESGSEGEIHFPLPVTSIRSLHMPTLRPTSSSGKDNGSHERTYNFSSSSASPASTSHGGGKAGKHSISFSSTASSPLYRSSSETVTAPPFSSLTLPLSSAVPFSQSLKGRKAESAQMASSDHHHRGRGSTGSSAAGDCTLPPHPLEGSAYHHGKKVKLTAPTSAEEKDSDKEQQQEQEQQKKKRMEMKKGKQQDPINFGIRKFSRGLEKDEMIHTHDGRQKKGGDPLTDSQRVDRKERQKPLFLTENVDLLVSPPPSSLAHLPDSSCPSSSSTSSASSSTSVFGSSVSSTWSSIWATERRRIVNNDPTSHGPKHSPLYAYPCGMLGLTLRKMPCKEVTCINDTSTGASPTTTTYGSAASCYYLPCQEWGTQKGIDASPFPIPSSSSLPIPPLPPPRQHKTFTEDLVSRFSKEVPFLQP